MSGVEWPSGAGIAASSILLDETDVASSIYTDQSNDEYHYYLYDKYGNYLGLSPNVGEAIDGLVDLFNENISQIGLTSVEVMIDSASTPIQPSLKL